MSTLIIIGASTRAAATSAWRAGWTPWCADLFADRDLERMATVRKVPMEAYPHGLIDALKDAPDGPVMYTGALENWPELIAKIDRPLLGNSAEVLSAVRSPERWTACLQAQGLPCPAIAEGPPSIGAWLLKPRRSAGGFGIRQYASQAFNAGTHFLQQRIEGDACSAVFLAGGHGAICLGVTQQLIGTPWLNASRFHYAGSIGPLILPPQGARRWRDVGAVLAEKFHLRGLFGVDAIMRNEIPWPVEINPRYTASVEVIERCLGHALIQRPNADVRLPTSMKRKGPFCGKAILFARRTFAFPADGPWLDAMKDNVDLDETEYADIPHAGDVIEQGRPVLTIFASAQTLPECERKLQEMAQALDRRLWG